MNLLLIPILIFVSVLCIGGAVLVVRSRKAGKLAARMATGSVSKENGEDVKQHLVATLDRAGKAVSSGKTSLSLKERLASAGFYSPSSSAAYIGAKMLLMLIALMFSAVTGLLLNLEMRAATGLTVIVGAMFFFLPNIVVSIRRNSRRDGIRRHLPDAVDLLEISISAGMGLDQAWNAVMPEMQSVSSHLSDEMALTNLEMHLGAPRATAMRHLAHRTGADELAGLVSVMIQSERFGTSMSDAMRNFASSMRENRSQKAQEKAETMAVKLIFPMILFLFPAIVLVTAGPAGLSLMKAIVVH